MTEAANAVLKLFWYRSVQEHRSRKDGGRVRRMLSGEDVNIDIPSPNFLHVV